MQLIRNNLIDSIAFCDYVDGVKAFIFVFTFKFVCSFSNTKFDSWIKCIGVKTIANAGTSLQKLASQIHSKVKSPDIDFCDDKNTPKWNHTHNAMQCDAYIYRYDQSQFTLRKIKKKHDLFLEQS